MQANNNKSGIFKNKNLYSFYCQILKVTFDRESMKQ